MHIDRDTLIFGNRPAMLKTLLKREHFSAIEAMRDLHIREPQASKTLRDLAADGWIKFDGIDHKGIEHWGLADKGIRLVATRLIKRFPIEEGLALLPAIIAKAEALNSDPESSRRIESIWLFGSVLTGRSGDDAGDIDLVVNVSRRPLPASELKALEDVEMSRAPERVQMGWFRDFRSTELLRQIKKVSHRISIHVAPDVEIFGLPYREIYRFDLKRDKGVTPRGDFRGKPAVGNDDDKVKHPPEMMHPDRPVAPNSTADIENATDLEFLLTAQHLFFRGIAIANIAEAVRLPTNAVQAYLSQLPQVQPFEPSDIRANFQRCIDALDPRFSLYFDAVGDERGAPRVLVTMLDAETLSHVARCHWVRKSEALFWGDTVRFPYLEWISEGAWSYFEKALASASGVDRSIRYFASHQFCEAPHVPKPQNLKPLTEQLIDFACKVRRSSQTWDASDAINIDFNQHRPISHTRGHRYYGDFEETKIKKSDAPVLWAMIARFKSADNDMHRARMNLILSAYLRNDPYQAE
ncbi:hypothetical protein EKN06_12330 [Croceicoccus ponticola]|uniref:Uncharacterized protein n=1 Tax=Croceicoccus ponticola TaxID=2217664 RepID=A0A437GV94_9SPHN|nr:hypothetical protein [Croceicoccus ponticola]RVQ65715.1 hypothetical protein EKN06_12330 [Croceicoccus ponticola]